MRANISVLPLLISSLLASNANAQTDVPIQIDGDLGGAVFASQGIVRGQGVTETVLPYAYLDAGRFYARMDTFGVKAFPLAYGYMEFSGRVSLEGYRASDTSLHGIDDRGNPLPLGIGSYQETPIGAFFLYAFHDLTSSGSLLEMSYATELDVGRWTLYPQLGVERRSARYVQHLYGVSSAESNTSGMPIYQPGGSTTPVLALAAEMPVSNRLNLNIQWRREWLDAAIDHSPLVNRRQQDTGFIALSYHFKPL